MPALQVPVTVTTEVLPIRIPEAEPVRRGLATWAGYAGGALAVLYSLVDSGMLDTLPDGVRLALTIGGLALWGITTGGRQLQANTGRKGAAQVAVAQAESLAAVPLMRMPVRDEPVAPPATPLPADDGPDPLAS